MSGICGLWNLDGAPVEPEVLQRMSAAIAHRGPDGEGHALRGAVGMACQHFHITAESIGRSQPVVDPSGLMLVFDGRLDNRAELLASPGLRDSMGATASDAELSLAAYRAFGPDFLARLNGDFALALFDPAARRLTLARDAIGVRPLYYSHRAQGLFLFGSEVKALLAHPATQTRPNDDVLAGVLLGTAYERAAPDETLFQGILRVLPGHAVEVSPQAVRVRKYWDFDPERRTRLASFAEYAEAFRHHFDEAVRRRARSAFPVAVSVSGGLDSSSILCAAHVMHSTGALECPALHGASYSWTDGSAADETAFLRDLERRHSISILHQPLRPLLCVDDAERSVWHTEDMLFDHLPDRGEFAAFVRRSGCRVLLTGHWGDQVMTGTDYWIDLFHALSWRLLSTHMKEYGRWYEGVDQSHFGVRAFVRSVVRRHLPEPVIPHLRRIRSLLHRASGRTPSSVYAPSLTAHKPPRDVGTVKPSSAFRSAHSVTLYEEVRSTYHLRCLEWNNKVGSMEGVDRAFPFLDRDLIAFLLSIPGEINTHRGVPRALLREGLREDLPNSISSRRTKGDFTDQVNEVWKTAVPALTEFLGERSQAADRGYLRTDAPGELDRLFSSLTESGTNTAQREISGVFALELWLRAFLDRSLDAARSEG